MARRNGFPCSIGSKMMGAADIVGPSSYTQYTAPSTGGQDVPIFPVCGLKNVDVAYGGVTRDGLHRAEVVQIEASTVMGQTLSDTQVVLKWYVVATGAEVAGGVDLSDADKTVRLLVIGDK